MGEIREEEKKEDSGPNPYFSCAHSWVPEDTDGLKGASPDNWQSSKRNKGGGGVNGQSTMLLLTFCQFGDVISLF